MGKDKDISGKNFAGEVVSWASHLSIARTLSGRRPSSTSHLKLEASQSAGYTIMSLPIASPSVIVRAPTQADYAAWRPLWDGYNAFYGRHGPAALPQHTTAVTWERFFHPAEPVFALVAQDQGQIVGLAHHGSAGKQTRQMPPGGSCTTRWPSTWAPSSTPAIFEPVSNRLTSNMGSKRPSHAQTPIKNGTLRYRFYMPNWPLAHSRYGQDAIKSIAINLKPQPSPSNARRAAAVRCSRWAGPGP